MQLHNVQLQCTLFLFLWSDWVGGEPTLEMDSGLQSFTTPPYNHHTSLTIQKNTTNTKITSIFISNILQPQPSLIMSETPPLHALKSPHDSRLYSNFEISLQMEKTFNVFHITDIISHPVCSDLIFSHYRWWSHWICSMWSLFSSSFTLPHSRCFP